MTTIATSPTAIATRPRLRNDAMSLLHANARTLAMRIASLPLLQQEAVLSVLVTEMDRRRLTPTSPTLMPPGPTAGRDA